MTDIDTVVAWQELVSAKARYCRFLDIKDWNSFADLLTDDFVLDVTEGTDRPIITGRTAAVEAIQSSILTAATAHHVHNPEIDVAGDEASVVWAMQDRVVWAPGGPSLTGYGHYHERWVRRDGRWLLAASKLTRLHLDIVRPDPG